MSNRRGCVKYRTRDSFTVVIKDISNSVYGMSVRMLKGDSVDWVIYVVLWIN